MQYEVSFPSGDFVFCKLKYGEILIMKTSKILGKIGEQLLCDKNIQLALFWPVLDKKEGVSIGQVFRVSLRLFLQPWKLGMPLELYYSYIGVT